MKSDSVQYSFFLEFYHWRKKTVSTLWEMEADWSKLRGLLLFRCDGEKCLMYWRRKMRMKNAKEQYYWERNMLKLKRANEENRWGTLDIKGEGKVTRSKRRIWEVVNYVLLINLSICSNYIFYAFFPSLFFLNIIYSLLSYTHSE